MSCILLRLQGPLQSWGYRSRFKDRDTGLEPTKSGVIGLLCCALGRDRKEPMDDLRSLKMFVRVDQEGTLLTDFHTAGAGNFRGRTDYFAPTSGGGKGKNAILMDKHYLMDACFLVALEGPESLLDRLEEALKDPVWPLSLGRRSCPPAAPVFLGRSDGLALETLKTVPWPICDSVRPTEDNPALRFVSELQPGDFQGDARQDVPIAWPDRINRTYLHRYVRTHEEKAP